jgi:hypothetical protein
MNSAHRDIKATRTLRQQEQWFGWCTYSIGVMLPGTPVLVTWNYKKEAESMKVNRKLQIFFHKKLPLKNCLIHRNTM